MWDAIFFYRSLFPKAKISLGGIYASLTPDHAKDAGADEAWAEYQRGEFITAEETKARLLP